MKRVAFSAGILAVIVLFSPLAIAVERHVPSEYTTIQAAINIAIDGDVIIVAPGTYTGAGNRDISFLGKAITVRSTNPQDPCVVAATIIDCQSAGRGFQFVIGEDNNSIVAGLTILNGRSQKGSGIFCSGASPIIEDCSITNCGMTGADVYPTQNAQNVYGGGLYCEAGSGPVLNNCIFSGNFARGGRGSPAQYHNPPNPVDPPGNGGHGYGGGIYCASDSNVTIQNCYIMGNTVLGGDSGDDAFTLIYAQAGNGYGGGIYGYGNISINNCVINNNHATGGNGVNRPSDGYLAGRGAGFGGGIEGNATIKNCLINDNRVADGTIGFPPSTISTGGGIKTDSSNISNCTITNNIVTNNYGSGISGSGATVIVNCIIWHNPGPGFGHDDLYGCSATYSCISDTDSGTGVIHNDPCFISGPLGMGDYYLSQTAAGQSYDSPCVNAGSDTAINLGMNLSITRTDGYVDTGIVDMGYHYPFAIDPDLNNDAFIDFFDYAILAGDWLLTPDPCDPNSGDIDKRGMVDIYDLVKLVEQWLDCLVISAASPAPTDNAINVNVFVILQWVPQQSFLSHDVYFGTDFNEVDSADITDMNVYMGNQYVNFWDSNNYDSNGLEPDATCYWRIDEIGPVCSIKGHVWSFTPSLPPEQASNPTPGNGTTGVSITTDLSWTAGSGATSHDVYFGATNPPPFRGNQTGTTYDTGTMDINKTYYWRIDEKNGGSTTTGDVWNFTTVTALYYPSSYTIVQGSYYAGSISNLMADDNTFFGIRSLTFGTPRYATVDFSVTGISITSPSKIDLKVVVKSSLPNTIHNISLWNYSTSIWDQIDSTTISMSEVTRNITVTSGAANYISSGTMQIRMTGSKTLSLDFNLIYDQIEVAITQ